MEGSKKNEKKQHIIFEMGSSMSSEYFNVNYTCVTCGVGVKRVSKGKFTRPEMLAQSRFEYCNRCRRSTMHMRGGGVVW